MAEPDPDLDQLVEIADALYALPAEMFTEARNARVREIPEKALAARVKKLKKPSVAAWSVNWLVRREADQIDAVLELAGSLREAAEALDGDELRALTRQRRQLTTALATAARMHARESGVRLTGPVVDQVERMLTAAMLDPVAADVLRSGLVVAAFSATGVSELDVTEVIAVPEAVGVRAQAAAPTPTKPTLHVVPDNGLKLEAAREAAEQAAAEVQQAEAELAEAEDALGRLQARRLQLQGEIDELRRRIAALEDDVDEVDEEIDEASAIHEDAVTVMAGARAEAAKARAAWDKLL